MTVIKFPAREDIIVIDQIPVRKPKNQKEYLFMCKDILNVQDYEEVLLAILDNDYYRDTDKEIQAIVDAYYSY